MVSGIEILIQRSAQINRFAVQIEFAVARREAAKAEAAAGGVSGTERDAQLVKIGERGAPQQGVADEPAELGACISSGHIARAFPNALAAGVQDLRRDAQRAGGACANDGRGDCQGAVRGSGNVHAAQPHARAIVEFHALPKAAGLDIPILLAMGDFRITNALDDLTGFGPGVGDAHRHLVFTRVEQGSDVDFKGQISALVRAGLLAVDVNLRGIIDGAKTQERHLVSRGRLQR